MQFLFQMLFFIARFSYNKFDSILLYILSLETVFSFNFLSRSVSHFCLQFCYCWSYFFVKRYYIPFILDLLKRYINIAGP